MKIIKEGGNAIKNSSRINQENVQETVNDIEKRLIKSLNISNRDVSLLGSTGKKNPGGSSGDIDLAVDMKSIVEKNKLSSIDDIFNFVESVVKKFSKNVVVSKGFKIVSAAWPIHNTDGKQKNEFVQLDLMFVNDVNFAKFAWYSPHEKNSKYGGVYRTLLMKAVADNSDFRVLKKHEDIPVEWKKNTIDMTKGLTNILQSKLGKNGLTKTHKTINSKLVTSDPEKIVKLIFGDKFGINDTDSFETIYKAINSNNFVNKKNKVKILKDFVKSLVNNKLPVPNELKMYENSIFVSKRLLTELIHLHDILNKSGVELVKKLLSDKLTVNLKIDQAALAVMRDGNKLRFFGREGKQEIDVIKRASMDLYEEPIDHIESRNWKQLPDKQMIYLELFSDRLNMAVKYYTKPKNNLIISYITDKSGKILKPNNPIVDKVAKILDVEKPPILFDGVLSNEQKNKILEFIQSDKEQRVKKFGAEKFMDYIMKLFIAPKAVQWLKADKYEGVVFYFNGDPFMSKLVDPAFTEKKSGEATERQKGAEITLDMNNMFFNSLKKHFDGALNSFKTNQTNSSLALIEFIAYLVEFIIEKDKQKYDVIAKHREEYEKNKFASLNYKFVPSSFKNVSKKYWFAEEMFKVILNSLKGDIKRARGNIGLTKQNVSIFNKFIEKLKNKNLIKEALDISKIPNKQNKKVDLFVGRMQPLHIGHAAIIKSMKNPVVVLVKGKYTSLDRDNNPFDEEFQKYMIHKVFPSVKIFVSNSAHLPFICNELRNSGFEVSRVFSGEDRIGSYKNQFKDNDKVPEDKRYDIVFKKTPRITSATKVRNAIRNNDKKEFEKLVPKKLHSDWNNMRKKMNLNEMKFFETRKRKLIEKIIGKIEKKINLPFDVVFPVNMTDHAIERLDRKEGHTSRGEVLELLGKVVDKIMKAVTSNDIKLNDELWITDGNVNLICTLSRGGKFSSGDKIPLNKIFVEKYYLKIITVMKKKDFKSSNHKMKITT